MKGRKRSHHQAEEDRRASEGWREQRRNAYISIECRYRWTRGTIFYVDKESIADDSNDVGMAPHLLSR